jgi:dolichyl-diphosphooligosaccharide--protein glycosyltransferase
MRYCARYLFHFAAQTVNSGSLRWGTINLMAYFYMVLSWGGYSFVINLIPIYCLACVVTGRLTARHYLAFAPLVFVGTLLAGEGGIVCLDAELARQFWFGWDALHFLQARRVTGRLTARHYLAFAPLVFVGTLLAGERSIVYLCICMVSAVQ